MCLLGKDRTPVGPVWRAACLPPPVALKLRPDALRFQQPARWRRLLLSTEEPSRLPPPGIFRLTQAVLPQEGFPSPSVGSLGFVNKRRFFFFLPGLISGQFILPLLALPDISSKIVLSSVLQLYVTMRLIVSNRIKGQSSHFCLNSAEKMRKWLNVEKKEKRIIVEM